MIIANFVLHNLHDEKKVTLSRKRKQTYMMLNFEEIDKFMETWMIVLFLFSC